MTCIRTAPAWSTSAARPGGVSPRLEDLGLVMRDGAGQALPGEVRVEEFDTVVGFHPDTGAPQDRLIEVTPAQAEAWVAGNAC